MTVAVIPDSVELDTFRIETIAVDESKRKPDTTKFPLLAPALLIDTIPIGVYPDFEIDTEKSAFELAEQLVADDVLSSVKSRFSVLLFNAVTIASEFYLGLYFFRNFILRYSETITIIKGGNYNGKRNRKTD